MGLGGLKPLVVGTLHESSIVLVLFLSNKIECRDMGEKARKSSHQNHLHPKTNEHKVGSNSETDLCRRGALSK
jgi:hypothetical protein